MKYFDADALPPCEISTHCLRLLNDLDGPGDARAIFLSNTRLACPWYLLEDPAEMRVLLLARPDHPADANNAR